ncbi:hypothetical protein AMATHDRAFT_149939 [Amanita thiersii Skay4041]|uniref:Zn(2)-C6 fungal-type domain-containing protein n=1 Tax=Amanita thiersii Skay4041 TaxID=703135 RepID=A0A2A9NBM1_9AGAR|nr:hypothetical protein AMATHDRAFT_149939 [Amanita thiersii Skay4041]
MTAEQVAQEQSQQQQTSTTQSTTHATAAADDAGKRKKTTKRRKVNHACLYCRRSHMTCDEGRPCQRCIKREIGHLCHDERRPKTSEKTPATSAATTRRGRELIHMSFWIVFPVTVYQGPLPSPNPTWPITVQPQQNTNSFLYQPETLGNEFSVLTDFLETLDESSFFTPPATVAPSLVSSASFGSTNSTSAPQATGTTTTTTTATTNTTTTSSLAAAGASYPTSTPFAPSVASSTSSTENTASSNASTTDTMPPILPAATKTEKFLLTAADQESGSRDERLNRVIRSKYEAGLLKPYNYVKGYARLSRWMDRNVSQESKQQILQPLSVLRPKFRAVAQSLRDIDLVFIEEAFERLLLDYDRVFSAMGVPACLWRRTGEIYKGNRQFSELVGVEGHMLREGRLCIYELMAEESAVNYWEKYGNVAFDSSQKAVLTSCVLRYKPSFNSPSSPTMAKDKGADSQAQQQSLSEEGFINCCFSFTIRRDKWGIPSMIVGNFIKC